MRRMLFAIIASALLAGVVSCGKDECCPSDRIPDGGSSAIGFGVYSSVPQTRASALTESDVKASGIGLFAYNQGQQSVEQYSSEVCTPDFIYNQKLEWDETSSNWTYSPVKYWPAESGSRLTFYAYAPWNSDLHLDGHTAWPQSPYGTGEPELTSDGTALVLRYDRLGPCIRYRVPDDPADGVDLMWGALTASSACPHDLVRQSIDGNVCFTMKHALSKLTLDVRVWVNDVTGGSSNEAIPSGTVVKIKSVTLKGNLSRTGELRLYDGQWETDRDAYADIALESGSGIFSAAVESGFSGDDARDAALPLLKGDNCLFLIPGVSFCFEIVYDVITTDSSNPYNCSTVTNTIRSTDTCSMGSSGTYSLAAGSAYAFHLTVGVRSVKFASDVDDWEDESKEVTL